MDPRALNDKGKRVQETKFAKEDLMFIGFIRNDLSGLKKCWEGLTEKEKKEFRKENGGIEDLIDCDIDEHAISAFMGYFDSKLRCFVLPKFDLTFTFEEYHFLTSDFWHTPDELYIPPLEKVKGPGPMQELERYCGVNNRWANKVLQVSPEEALIDWQQAYLLMEPSESDGSRKKERNEEASKKRKNFLKLGIYGLILFPKVPNRVGSKMMKLIIEEENSGKKDIMHTVLAETIRTCIFIRERQRGPLRCCAQLFTLWIYAHFPTASAPDTDRIRNPGTTAMSRFGRPTRKYLSRQRWEDFLSQVGVNEVTWRAPWLRSVKKYLRPPTEKAWIPVFGLQGIACYLPYLVMRQLGIEQKVPSIGGDRADLTYDNQPVTKVDIGKMRTVWTECTKEDVIPSIHCCAGYDEWRKKRVEGKIRFKRPKTDAHDMYIESQEKLEFSEQRRRTVEEEKLQLEVDLRGANENRKELKKVKGERDEAIDEVEKVAGKAEAEIRELKAKDRRFNAHLKQKSVLADKLMRTVPEQHQYIKQLEAECKSLREKEEIWQGNVEWLQKKREEDKEMMEANAEELRQAKKEIDLHKLANRMQALRREASENCINDPILNMKGFSSAIEQDREVRAILRRQKGLAPCVDEVLGYLAGRLVWFDVIGDTEGFWLDAEKRIADLHKSNKEFLA